MSLIESIKELFSKKHSDVKPEETVANAEKEKVAHEKFALADGKEVEISALEVGGTIEFMLEDGSTDGAEPGEYTLADGRIIVVAEKGIIAEIKDAPAAEENSKVEVNNEGDLVEIKNSILFLAERIKSIEDENKKLKVENSKLEAENKAIKNAPVPATEKKKIAFKKLEEKNAEVIKGKYADFISSLRK